MIKAAVIAAWLVFLWGSYQCVSEAHRAHHHHETHRYSVECSRADGTVEDVEWMAKHSQCWERA